ncbi:MAG TPA: hypothetical protein VNX17_12045, partial [Edaphobacter sp.]|nr:hypothetical protein [Edaphobacter sp.]
IQSNDLAIVSGWAGMFFAHPFSDIAKNGIGCRMVVRKQGADAILQHWPLDKFDWLRRLG